MLFRNRIEIPSRPSVLIITATLSLFLVILIAGTVIDVPSADAILNSNYFFLKKWGSRGAGDGQFFFAHSVAVDSSGYVYVGDMANHRIQKFQLAKPCPVGTTQIESGVCFVTKWGSRGSGNGQFELPVNVAVDSLGRVYVVDNSNNNIQVFNGNGGFIKAWGKTGSGDGQFKALHDIAIDPAGYVYVADAGNSRIQKFLLSSPCPTGTTQVEAGVCFVTKFTIDFPPVGIALDSTGRMFVVDNLNGGIEVLDRNGGFIKAWDLAKYPYGVAVDSSGYVYVAEYGPNNRIEKFQLADPCPFGTTQIETGVCLVTQLGKFGHGDGEFSFSEDVAIGPKGRLFVGDSSNNRIQVFSEASSEVSADFNGDGSDDLAIGAPFEDEGDSCTTNIPISGVTASGNDGNVPQNVLDNNIATRWSSLGIGQSITADLGSTNKICSVDIAWYKGNARQYHFVIATSTDGTTFTTRLSRDSNGTTTNSEKYAIPLTNARYIRVTVNGNTQNNWASMTELDIFGPALSQIMSDSGAVNVIYGSSGGLSATALSPINGRADQILTQSITGGLEAGDVFGYALATGDFNRDGFSDLAIGVPGEDIGTTMANAGAVNVIYGSSMGLSAAGNQIWTQNTPDIEGNAEAGDRFGGALASGDFNRDGFSDLAIGVPQEDVVNSSQINIINAGAVNIIYGSSNGLNASATPDELWTENLAIFGVDAEQDDNFGAVLASGDFEGNGFSDLAIGVTGQRVGPDDNAGTVDVLYYRSDGAFNWQRWTQDSTDVEDTAEAGDRFGGALKTGDFNKDGVSDLAIGASSEDVGPVGGNVRDAGTVNVIYGSFIIGLWPTAVGPNNGRDDQIWTQDSPNVEDVAEEGDDFGDALAVGDFNKDGISDLAIGVSAEDVGAIEVAGAINVIYGSSEGLSPTRLSPVLSGRDDQIWTQDSPHVEDNAESIDIFGSPLTSGDFNKDGISDLAIGAALEDEGTIGNSGAVNVIYGSLGLVLGSEGLSPTVPLGGIGRNDQIWTQNSPGIEDDAQATDKFGNSLG
jgi:F5/8 type C domain/6-bladed beta-propeller/FG-GAP repeat/NHL repeat